MGFFSAVKKFFSGGGAEVEKTVEAAKAEELQKSPVATPSEEESPQAAASEERDAAEEAPVSAEEPEGSERATAHVETASASGSSEPLARSEEEETLALALRQAEPRLSAWLAIVLDGVEEADDLLWKRLAFLLRALETPDDEARAFLDDFRGWLESKESISWERHGSGVNLSFLDGHVQSLRSHEALQLLKNDSYEGCGSKYSYGHYSPLWAYQCLQHDN